MSYNYAARQPPQPPPITVDFEVWYGGGFWVVSPETTEAFLFVDYEMDVEPWQWLANGFLCECGYIAELITSLREQGFIVHVDQPSQHPDLEHPQA